MTPFRILDLFCGAGGASMGMHQAFQDAEIFGVDKEFQKRYPFNFIQADALTFDLSGYDFYWASPPCQIYSKLKGFYKKQRLNIIDPIRSRLQKTGKPFIIENVPGAPLINPIMLCGTMFGLRVIRHRHFETYPQIWFPQFTCNHWGKTHTRRDKRKSGLVQRFEFASFLTITGNDYIMKDAKIAMNIDWMIGSELSQAIPPNYSRWLITEVYKKLNKDVI
jgi:DNA (cytosine-5)-methyltransferase 1